MSEKGGCLCGQFSYSFPREAVVSAHHCHCTDCQKMTGSGKATIIMVPTQTLEMAGELKTFTVTGTDGGRVTRAFCPTCGSQILSYLEGRDALKFVKAGTLEQSDWVTISSSFWATTARSWDPVKADAQAFETNPSSV
ncbi:MAG: GFA family protein [Pseudomonadales bacterium]|nr:GFA family protein [Pseudomonadales bacterium]